MLKRRPGRLFPRAGEAQPLTHLVKWLNAVLAVSESSGICVRLRFERLRIPGLDYFVNLAFHHLGIEVVDHSLSLTRAGQILFAIHLSGKSSHTNSPTGLKSRTSTYIWLRTRFVTEKIQRLRRPCCGRCGSRRALRLQTISQRRTQSNAEDHREQTIFRSFCAKPMGLMLLRPFTRVIAAMLIKRPAQSASTFP